MGQPEPPHPSIEKTSTAGQSYQWRSLAWQTASSQWPLETVRGLTDLRPAGGGGQKE